MAILRPKAEKRETWTREYAPTWPVTAVQVAIGVLTLSVVVSIAAGLWLRDKATGNPTNPKLAMWLVLAAVAIGGVVVVVALVAIVSGFRYRTLRARVLASGFLAIALGAGTAYFGTPELLAMRQLAQHDDQVAAVLRDELQSAGKVASASDLDRVKRLAKATHAAAANSSESQKATLQVIAVGLDRIATKLAAHGERWDALQKAGAADARAFASAADVQARHDLVTQATASGRELDAELSDVRKEWDDKLAPPAVEPEMYSRLTKAFIETPQKAVQKDLAITGQMEPLVGMLHRSFGEWSIEDGAVVFKLDADKKIYAERLAALQAVAGDRISAAPAVASTETGAPALDEEEARQYAQSYVALIQRGHFDEAHKYLPPELGATVTAAAHQQHWVAFAGEKREEVAVAGPAESPRKDGLAFRVEVPGKATPGVIVVLKSEGKTYAAPLALLPPAP